jgi:hypothetical protein
LVTSDRRLKKEITPIQRTLREAVKTRGLATAQARAQEAFARSQAATSGGGGGDGALWLLRQLRPVSYSFRSGAESKYMRFGFIADELESVVPEVVRSVGNQRVNDQKAVVYQDLIAILTAAQQSQQQRIETLEGGLGEVRGRLQSLEKVVTVLCKASSIC